MDARDTDSTPPTIFTSRLRIAAAAAPDRGDITALWRHRPTCRALFGEPTLSVAQAGLLFDRCLAHPGTLWVVRSRATAAMVAGVSLRCWPNLGAGETLFPRLAMRASFSVAVTPPLYGVGYAGEAATALIAHAFDSLGLSGLTATCALKDKRSLALLKHLGFVLHGRRELRGSTHRTYVLRAADCVRGARMARAQLHDDWLRTPTQRFAFGAAVSAAAAAAVQDSAPTAAQTGSAAKGDTARRQAHLQEEQA
jgi:RimJ/RimL family protein N-acetyltransferase